MDLSNEHQIKKKMKWNQCLFIQKRDKCDQDASHVTDFLASQLFIGKWIHMLIKHYQIRNIIWKELTSEF